MHGPIVDVVLLALLVLFFGRQQNQRPETYYRLWFVGWLFVMSSYVVSRLIVGNRPVIIHLQEAARLDLMLVGTLVFLASFLITEKRFPKSILRGILVGVPVVAVFNAIQFMPVGRGVLMAAVVAWEAYGVRVAYVLIPKGRTKTRFAIFASCVVFGAGILFYLAVTPGRDVFELALAEVVFCAAVLYGGGLERRSLTIYIGMAGFVMWCGFYIWADLVGAGFPHALALLYLFWTVPKYFVGFSMITKTFEDDAEEKARLAEGYRRLYEDFRVMFDGHPNPMWVYAQEDGRILSANESAVSGYGYTVDEFLRMRYEDLVVTSDEETSMLDTLYHDAKAAFARHQLKDGRKIWANVSHSNIKFRGVDAIFQIARDITDRVEDTKRRAHDASHDVLTGLPNRALFEDRIQQCLKRCEREDRKGTLLTIDVDHFKWINDTYGHQVGDECLKIVAARLASKIRQVDTIARVGGEEFAAIVGGLHIAEDAQKVADSLLRVFQEPLWLGEIELSLTVSIGIAVYPDDASESEMLARLSDEALYAAKRAGRNRAVTAASMVAGREMVEELGAA